MSYAVIPVVVIVMVLNFTLTPLGTTVFIRFVVGAMLIILGLTVFLLGVDIGITPVGNALGAAIARTNKMWIVVVAGLALGFFISIAEPDLHIIAGQVDLITSGSISKAGLIVTVSIGIAVLLAVGLLRTVYNITLSKMLLVLYGVVLLIAVFTSPEFLAVSFDASGATTGALTVPLILALALGVSVLKKDARSSENDSFGLVAIVSTGAIMTVMLMSIISGTDGITGSLEYSKAESASIFGPFFQKLPVIAIEVFVALFPILMILVLFNRISLKMPRKAFRRAVWGIFFTFVGFVIFLVGVNAGFMSVGSAVGHAIASLNSKALLILVGFGLGTVTILAEPAVHVLTHEIEEVTSGFVMRKVVLVTLSIGVGVAVALSMVRILVPAVELWHFLLPGYMISLAMTFFIPKLFVGIAFDSGGVASGPMTATFMLAFSHGAADAIEGANLLADGFGMIAMVALTPIIALPVLGLIFKIKTIKRV